jgi:hypothetical protein
VCVCVCVCVWGGGVDGVYPGEERTAPSQAGLWLPDLDATATATATAPLPACAPPLCVSAPRYYPLYTRRLNTEVKGNRALLLLLPMDVIDSVSVSVRCCAGEGATWMCGPCVLGVGQVSVGSWGGGGGGSNRSKSDHKCLRCTLWPTVPMNAPSPRS